tara:strand:- start:85 stop:630 length:546 start_codon:yes stop_codon:yes gene_type:complete
MNPNQLCSKYFKYIDFIQASDTQKKVNLDNVPKQEKTFKNIEYLAKKILDPVFEEFGPIEITYGFCSHNLQKHIKRNVAPKLDQHAGSELNSRGNLICQREGFAVDFKIKNINSTIVSEFVIRKTNFDRLYFYGNTRPIHVSATSENPSKHIYIMRPTPQGKVPLKCHIDNFSNTVSKLNL